MKMHNARFINEEHTIIALELDGTEIEVNAIPGLTQYDALIASGLPIAPLTPDAAKELRIDRIDLMQLRIAFNHENRLRVLEAKPEITMQQFKAALKALL